MDILHRYNSVERQHYLFKKQNPVRLKPRLLYVGELKKNAGWKESNHSHEFCEIIYIPEGHGFIYSGDIKREVKKGDIILYNANQMHFEESSKEEPMVFYFLAFDGLQVSDLDNNCIVPDGYDFIYHSGEHSEIIKTIFEQMISEFKEEKEFYLEISQSMSRSLLMYIFRIIDSQSNAPLAFKPKNKNIETAIKYINENFKENITLEDIAKNCFINKYHLAHEFSKFQGMSVGKYILSLRISEAMRLLRETNISVNEISEEIGFYDMSYFCRIFKKTVSLTPLQYRKKVRNEME